LENYYAIYSIDDIKQSFQTLLFLPLIIINIIIIMELIVG